MIVGVQTVMPSSDADEKDMINLSKKKNLVKLLIKSMAPDILGHDSKSKNYSYTRDHQFTPNDIW